MFPQTSATEAACRTQACAHVQRWKFILKEYNQLEDAYLRRFPHAVSPSKSTGAGRGKRKGALTWDRLMADYEASAEDRKFLMLLWPHVREMGYAKDDRAICVSYFAANVVLGLDEKSATTQCTAHLKSLNLSLDVEDVANTLQNILDAIEPTFKTIIEVDERKNRVTQTPSKGKGRAGLPLGVKSTPSKTPLGVKSTPSKTPLGVKSTTSKTPLRKTESQALVKESPLKRRRGDTEDKAEMEERVLPTPKRVRIDSSVGSESSVIEESDIADAPPSSEAEVESMVQFPFFKIGRGNTSITGNLPDEDAEGDGGMDAMEVDDPITPSKRKVLARQERSPLESKPEPRREALEDVEEMDWSTLAAYRKRLIGVRSNRRDMTEFSRARWRPVFADRDFWDGPFVPI